MLKQHRKYPIYIISKGRWESRLTAKALDAMHTPYYIVIEPQEYKEYAAVIDKDKIFILPFSNLGQGSIPARNWVWEHSIMQGDERHWILDDNIRHFYRVHNNNEYKMDSDVCFEAIEDFVDRYENVALAGMQYQMFVLKKEKCDPIRLNTRIYSCILIKNSLKFRWRGRYNEDTDLSLNVLKAGWCTVLFNSFICQKTATMRLKGGNTDELYKQNEIFDGRLEMAKALQRYHPDVTKITRKWGRWQHQVDYSKFKNYKLIKKNNIIYKNENNEYGMCLIN